MTVKQFDYLCYIFKCLIGLAIGFYLYRAYPQIGLWCLVSIVLVLSPDRQEAMNQAKNRIIANFIGAAIGLALFFIHPANLLMLCTGVTLTLITCQLLKLQDVTRTAAVSVIIILLHQKGQYFWDVALERAAGVFLGCILGMVITVLFHYALKRYKV